MRFNYYIKLLLESSFASLPSSPPYGMWITPSGEFRIVSRTGHHSVAEDIIAENKVLRAKFNKIDPDLIFVFMNDNKYIRVVFETRHDNLYYSCTFTPSHRQIQTIKDLAMLYDISNITYDNKI